MKINREALKAGLQSRIILTDDEYNTILDALEETHKSYSEKIIENNPQEPTDPAEQCFDNANAEWREMALEVVHLTCISMDRFTVNDFRNKLKGKTHDNRAVGGLMKTACAKKWCRSTGNTIQSKVGHKSPLQIWESLL